MEARRKRHHAIGWAVVLALLVIGVGVTASEAGRPHCGSFLVPRSTERSIEQMDPSLAGAAHEFQPTLAVARADRNWPVSIETVLHLQVGRHHTCHRSAGCSRVPESG